MPSTCSHLVLSGLSFELLPHSVLGLQPSGLAPPLGNGDRKLISIIHAAASQEKEGKLTVSDYSGCQTVHLLTM